MIPIFVILGLVALCLVGYGLFSGRRNTAAVQAAQLRPLAEDDLRALSDEINRLGQGPESANERVAALECETRARRLLEEAQKPSDLVAVSSAIASGYHAVACGRARVAGQEWPPERALCFFDPAHGRSTRDVSWTPPGLGLRNVPACAACASAAEHGLEPSPRTVRVDGHSMPYWDAPSWYGSWASGYFSSARVLYAGLPIGS